MARCCPKASWRTTALIEESSSCSSVRTSSASSSSSRPSGSTTASSSARRPRRTRSPGRTTGRARSPSRSGQSGAACRAYRRSSSPAAASTASRRDCERCAGLRSWRPERASKSPGKDGGVATSPTSTDRWKALDFGPPPSDLTEPDSPVLIEYGSDGRVAVITLNRPHADNAITTEMGARLTEVLETIAVRPAVRVAIITGAGDRAFSVGRQLRKPIFAAVNGIAYGGGCEIAQSTDFIIASDNARFGQPEAMIGLAAGGGSPALLPRVLPPGKALQMLMTGDPITAQEAYRLGMVNEIHPQP